VKNWKEKVFILFLLGEIATESGLLTYDGILESQLVDMEVVVAKAEIEVKRVNEQMADLQKSLSETQAALQSKTTQFNRFSLSRV
jgi:hypothetical protein